MTAFIGRNGQGKTNLVEAIDYLSRLASHRVASDAPLVRAGADQALVRAAVVRDGRTAMLEVEINPGRSNRARVNRSPAPPGPRADRPGAHGRLLARGPDPGQGRPVRPAPLPRRPARPAHAAPGRRARRLRPDPAAAQHPAEDGRRTRAAARRARRARSPPSASGTPTSPGPAPSCSPSGWRWSTRCARTSARPTRPSRAGRAARTPRSSTSRRSTSRVSRQALARLPQPTMARWLRRLRCNRLETTTAPS